MSTENNIKIAEHIGMQKSSLGWFDNEEVLIKVEKDNTFDDLKFDKSWDWLSAVVSHLSLEHDRDNDNDFDVLCYEVSDAVLENDLVRAYNSVITFIDSLVKPEDKMVINFTESDIEEMLSIVRNSGDKQISVFNWIMNGELVKITVGND